MAGISEAAAIIGIASFSITVFHGCVKGLEIIRTARAIGKDGNLFRWILEWEQYRLFEWAAAVGLLDDELQPDPALNWYRVKDLLEQLHRLSNNTELLTTRYGLQLLVNDGNPSSSDKADQASSDDGNDEAVGSAEEIDATSHRNAESNSRQNPKRFQIRNLALHLRPEFYTKKAEIIHSANNPLKKLRWSNSDKKKVEDLIVHIGNLVDCLHEALKFADRRQMKAALSMLVRRAIARNHDEEGLVAIRNLNDGTPTNPDLRDAASTRQSRLGFDHDIQSSEGSSQPVVATGRAEKFNAISLKLPLLRRHLRQSGAAGQREQASYNKTPVLVEWRWFDLESRWLLYRVRSLAVLLVEAGSSFHTLACMGLLDDREHGRFGLVFKIPMPSSKTAQVNPVDFAAASSGAETLGSQLQQSTLSDGTPSYTTLANRIMDPKAEKPAWNIRRHIAILVAESVLQLHTAGWLHKSIRSDNVLFVGLHAKWSDGYHGPYMAGFDFARNASPTEMSEAIASNEEADLYRHPATFGDLRTPFRKEFDLYALGLLLLEIGLWKQVKEHLSAQAVVEAQEKKDVHVIRKELIGDGNGALSDVRFCCGERFAEAVELALRPQAGERDAYEDVWEESIETQNRIVELLRIDTI